MQIYARVNTKGNTRIWLNLVCLLFKLNSFPPFNKFNEVYMKKSLVALAALASISAFAQTAAPAPITVYGMVDYGLAGATGASAAFLPDNNSTSRFGIKGTVAAGSGININYDLEAGHVVVAAKPSNQPFFERAAWAGFSGNFGEIRAGTQYSLGFQQQVGFDLNGAANDSQASALSGVPTLGLSTYNGTASGSLAQYISPTVAGFTLQVGWQPQRDSAVLQNQANSATPALAADTGVSAGAAGVTYVKGPFAAAVTFEGAQTNNPLLNTSNNWYGASASYDLGVAKVVGTYANGDGANGTGLKGYNLGVQVPVAGVNVGLQYSKNTDTSDTGTEVFANKEVLKNVTAYFDYGYKLVNATSTNSYVYSVGAIWAF